MLFSVCAVDRELSKDIPFPMREKSFRDCARLAELLGFNGIELQVQDPADYDAKALKRTLDFYGIRASAITTGMAYTFEGLSLSHKDDNIRKAAVERMKRQLDFARELESQILIGYMRGRKAPGQSDEEYESILTDSIGEVAEYGANIGAATVFEQINHRDGDVFNSTERTMTFLEKFHNDWLLYNGDTYHMADEDPDIPAAIRRSLSKLVLFHVSDVGRLLPDGKHFDFEVAADTLIAEGYNKWVTIETKPIPDALSSCVKGIRYLKTVFRNDSKLA